MGTPKLPRIVKMVIFDLDGTLVDTPKSFMRKVRIAGERCGLEPDEGTYARADKAWGKPLIELLLFIYPQAKDEDVVSMLETFNELDVLEPPEFFPGGKETLRFCIERDVVCTILTSRGSRSLISLLHHHEVHDHFRHLVARDHVEHPKPDARSLTCTLKLMEELGILREEAVLVGDTYDDLHTGKNSGLRTVIVRTGSFKETDPTDDTFTFECIDSIADLPRLLF